MCPLCPRQILAYRYIIYRGRGILYDWAESARFSESKCGEKVLKKDKR